MKITITQHRVLILRLEAVAITDLQTESTAVETGESLKDNFSTTEKASVHFNAWAGDDLYAVCEEASVQT